MEDEFYNPDLDEWRQLEEFPGYWISASGYLMGPGRHGKGSITAGTPTGSCGHMDVSIKKDGVRYHRYIHRLVAENFIPNPYNYPIVRHLDGDPTNNHVDNLAWGTQKDNVHDSMNLGTYRPFTEKDRFMAHEERRDPVVLIDLLTGEKTEYGSQADAARDIGCRQSEISRSKLEETVIQGRYIATSLIEEIDADKIDPYKWRHGWPVLATNIVTGECIIGYGQTDIANKVGVSVASVSMCVHGNTDSARGWKLRYLREDELND